MPPFMPQQNLSKIRSVPLSVSLSVCLSVHPSIHLKLEDKEQRVSLEIMYFVGVVKVKD